MLKTDENIIKASAEKHLLNCRPGDWQHAQRVVRWIKDLGDNRSDLLLLITAGYIHDIGWEGIFPKDKEKITFQELLQFEELANNNSEKFAIKFLKELKFNQDEIEIISRLIRAADEHRAEKDDEAVIVDADRLSKLDINHLKEKYQQSEWLKMYELWESMEKIQSQKAKEIYPNLLAELKISINKEIANV